jgi:NADH-quinone oxidoreductase subunit L
MTAAYMTRCVWLTFFGEFRGHGHPHESPALITAPLVTLTVMALGAGWFNGFGLHYFQKWTENDVVAAAIRAARATEAKFNWGLALVSLGVAILAIVVTFAYYELHAFARLHELTRRSRAAHAGYDFLENKYYLDHLYTDLIVGGIKSPVARAAYWINQNVIDGVVNGIAIGCRYVAQFVYDYIDQGVVDGAVNGAGASAEEGGSILRLIQTGRVQQYAAAFFGIGVVILGAGLLALTHAFG